VKTPAERRHAHALLRDIEAHFPLEPRQLALVADLRALLPVAAGSGLASTRRRKTGIAGAR
jgi:hypothetical protein